MLPILFYRYVFWYHNERMVNYDTERGVSVMTSHGTQPSGGGGGGPVVERSQSKFTIAEATPQDSGNYTCKPSNAMPASIQVFVSKSRGTSNSKNIYCTSKKKSCQSQAFIITFRSTFNYVTKSNFV